MIWSSGNADLDETFVVPEAVFGFPGSFWAEFFWEGSIVLIAITDSHATPETPD
jgi:hypothetical protein